MIAYPIEGKRFQLHCTGCKKPCDIVDYEEFKGLSSGSYGPYYCFECDNKHVDEVPIQLLSDTFPYLLKLGDNWFLIDPWRSARESMRRFYLAVSAFQKYINERREDAKNAYSNFCNKTNVD
jgi:hypothetical protein